MSQKKNEKQLFSVNKFLNDYTNKLDKYLTKSTSGISSSFSNSTLNNHTQKHNIYLTQSVLKHYLNQPLNDLSSSTGTASTSTRSTTLLSLPALFSSGCVFRESSFNCEPDFESSELFRDLAEDKLITTSDNSIEKTLQKSENLQSFSPITPIIDFSNNSEVFSDYSPENTSPQSSQKSLNSDDLVYKSIMIIDVLNRLKNLDNNNSMSSTAQINNPKSENAVFKSEFRFSQEQQREIDDEKSNQNLITISKQHSSLIRNVIRKSFNNFYLLNDTLNKIQNDNHLTTSFQTITKLNDSKLSWDDVVSHKSLFTDEKQVNSYDLTQSDKLAINTMFKLNHLNNKNLNYNKKKFMKKNGKHNMNPKKIRKKIKENPYFLYNRKCMKKLLKQNHNNPIFLKNSKKLDIGATTTDMDSIVSSFSYNDCNFDCFNTSHSNSSGQLSPNNNNNNNSNNGNKCLNDQDENSKKKDKLKNCNLEINQSKKSAKKSYLYVAKKSSDKNNQSCRRNSCESTTSGSRRSNSDSSENMDDERCRRSSESNSDCSSASCSSNTHAYHANQHSNREYEYLQNCDTNEDPTVEYARADDDFDMNDQVKSSDEDFTGSYADILSQKDTIKTNGNNRESRSVENKIHEEILNLIIHRLPGEKLGLNLKVESNGSVLVVSVIENSAADRASDLNGNRCAIKIKDELLEINGVTLNNMSNDDILTVVQELPLHVTLKLKRTEYENTTSQLFTNNENNESIINSGHSSPNITNIKIPIGYNLHTIYLSSLESKCIMPCDLRDCSDAEGLYKIQKSTLQIGEQDSLKKGDILFNINGEQMAFKNKFELVSKLSNLGGIAEVSVLRKTNQSCYGSSPDQIPYHNGIFAQNSIKLAMRKYDKPSIKSGSDGEIALTAVSSQVNFTESSQKSSKSLSSKSDVNAKSTLNDFVDNKLLEQTKVVNDLIKENSIDSNIIFNNNKITTKPSKNEVDTQIDENIDNNQIFNLNHDDPIISSFHNENDNWLLYDKNSTQKILANTSMKSTKSNFTDNIVMINNQYITKSNSSIKESENYNYNNLKDKKNANYVDLDNSKNDVDDDNDLEEFNQEFKTKSLDTNNENLNEQSLYFEPNDNTNTVRSLTSSSCHSERSVIHLNCVVCFEDENTISNLKTEPSQAQIGFLNESKNELIESVNLAGLGNGIGVGLGACAKVTQERDIDKNDCNIPKCESSLISPESTLPLYQSVVQPAVAIKTESLESIKSPEPIINKFVSTCQIEIKKQSNPNFNFKKFTVHKSVKGQSDDKVDLSVEAQQLNEMTFNKEVPLNSSNSLVSSDFESTNSTYPKEVFNFNMNKIEIEKIEENEQTHEKSVEKIDSDEDLNVSADLKTVCEDNPNQDFEVIKENTENDCDQNCSENLIDSNESEKINHTNTNNNDDIEIDIDNFNLVAVDEPINNQINESDNEIKIDSKQTEDKLKEYNNEIQSEDKHIEFINLKNIHDHKKYDEDDLKFIREIMDNILDQIENLIESQIVEHIDEPIEEPKVYSISNSVEEIKQDENIISEISNSDTLSSLDKLYANKNEIINLDQKQQLTEFNDLKKLMHEELSNVMKDKSSAQLTDMAKNESVLEPVLSEIQTDTSFSQFLKNADVDINLKQSTQLNLTLNESGYMNPTSLIPPAPPLPERLFGSLSEICSVNNSFDNSKINKNLVCQQKEEKQADLNSNIDKENQISSSLSSGIDTIGNQNKEVDQIDNATKLAGSIPNINDRVNSLVTARPFNSLQNLNQKLNLKSISPSSYSSKTLSNCIINNNNKRTSVPISKLFLTQSQQLLSNRSNKSLNSAIQKSASFQKETQNNVLITSGINTLKSSNSFSLKNEKNKKDEPVIDYVESAFEKEIKQKIQTPATPTITTSGLTQSDTGLGTNNVNIISKTYNLISNSFNKVEDVSFNNENNKQKLLKNQSVECLPKPNQHEVVNKAQSFSVKEKIMLFTNNNQSSMFTKPVTFGSKLADNKSVVVKSSLNIPSSNNISQNVKNDKNLNESKKFHSATALNKPLITETVKTIVDEPVKLSQAKSENKLEQIGDHRTQLIPNFKSVKDKIAYFSSKSKQENQSASIVPAINLQNQANKQNDIGKNKTNGIANKIEIISSSIAQELALKQYNSQRDVDDYDSLKHAYKLNAMNSATAALSSQHGKSCFNLKTFNEKSTNIAEVKHLYSSTNSINICYGSANNNNNNNNAKFELKTIIHNNENKISDMIENIETKMKNGCLYQQT